MATGGHYGNTECLVSPGNPYELNPAYEMSEGQKGFVSHLTDDLCFVAMHK